MKLQRLSLTLEQLRSIPKAERSLVVLLSYAMNEVNTLNKLFFFASRIDQNQPLAIAHAQSSQAFILARTLIGKLNEAWVLVKNGYFGAKLSQTYESRLDTSGLQAMKYLKSYFGHANLIFKVRNSFAFHYSLEHANTDIPDDSSANDLAMYLHGSNGNSLYYFAEYLMSKALIEEISLTDPEAALGQLLDEMVAVTSNFNEFAQAILFVILDKYVGKDVLNKYAQTVEIGPVEQSVNINIPFFYEISAPVNGRFV